MKKLIYMLIQAYRKITAYNPPLIKSTLIADYYP